MVLAGVLEGTSIGFFQWRVLRRVYPPMTARAWLIPTIVVAAIGWFVGMLPQTFFASSEAGEVMPEPSPAMVITVAAVFGAVAGAVFGFAQWLVLRRYVKHAVVWIWANAIGWALAMAVIYVGASLPNAEWRVTAVIVTGAVTGIVAGLAIGAVTGAGLVRVLKDPR